MLHKIIQLSKKRNVTLATYFLDSSEELQPGFKRPIIIVCPGGGYNFLSDREAEIIALQYTAAGYHACVLRYGINEHAIMPGPILDLADAVAYIRSHAEEWLINENQIFVCGFSAGAHVAAGLSVFWNNAKLLAKYKKSPEQIKPNGTLLGYPVIDLHSTCESLDIGIKKNTPIGKIEFSHLHPKMPLDKLFIMDKKTKRYMVNFRNAMNAYMFGGEFTEEDENFYSLQNHVSASTPPAFIWHGGQDGLIYPINSLMYASKLAEHKIPYELHIFSNGDHGLSLASTVTANNPWQMCAACEPWLAMSIDWIDRQCHFSENIKKRF